MCGIIAICNNDKKEINILNIYNSYKILKNRGPDNGNFIVNDDKIMGFRRLTINDISSDGNQPFNKGENVLMCNGEIFNYKELIKKYNLDCKSESDCECIIHLYDKLGFHQLITELIGDFAIVLFTKDKFYFGCDRVGVRPLFYGFTKDNNLSVASYARALTGLCDNINQLKPGWAEYNYSNNKLDFFKYDPPQKREIKQDIYETVHNLLTTSVKDRLMSDRPIGCLLSGGLDSSLITSILCKLVGPKNVRTYSIGMKGSNDLFHAKQVSEFLGTTHTEVLFTPEEGFKAIPEVIRDLESYDITTIRASVGMWLLAKYITENTDDIVLYSGEGADELFCGYLYFHYAPNLEELGKESIRLIKDLHMYDVLRADRCISSHGLELRVPFLDPRLTELSQSLDEETIAPKNGIEKHLLRTAFSNKDYLPDNVLWRRKDGMSDGISGDTGKKWFQQIQDFVDLEISDKEFEQYKSKFPLKEAYYYKKIFDNIFPNYQPVFEYWMPKWVECNGDPSGRNLEIFENN